MIEKKKNRSELKREAILAAAKKAYQDDGVQNTSMDKLASLAQVSKRTVYNHFSSKEALVMELLSDLWQKSMADIDIQFSENVSIQDQLERLLLAELNVIGAQSYLDLAKVAFGHFFYKPDELQLQVEKMAEQETALSRWLQLMMDTKKLTIEDKHKAGVQLHSLLKGSAFWPQLVGMRAVLSSEEKEQLVTETADMFLSRYLKR
ncbi:TetR/AcrR family transcriptional regulator [Aliivibrio fischeri]|uniref:TetR/AcrR family transcriptional regulator n=1 Tax=Aliivibrio fischeri TaxID=668 RepID=UPI0007C54D58|nr:TetR/AcrR family transcriptional regulator [Aliivibrio fischeri]MCE7555355.1 TetR/AcrR family transcriptional regulator [Aliivibrio fischeri]MCE7562623.1 TetR/AcrR family transcriptional regulator [Aliivibrio fischeri]MCE7570031.1 TetR/AcrR family transcriptional regulator [Aliivibrio fischeri]MCE7577361.1 TetR/AcrR family transcriptional regulator [Aliivibrio fischeri]MCE7589650.1 TetR/AcrR family transcriptional regulator [Aliivibrio fischeri]